MTYRIDIDNLSKEQCKTCGGFYGSVKRKGRKHCKSCLGVM